MIDKNGVRYWGLFLVAAGIATLVVCALGLIDPELVFRYGPYAAPAAAAFMLVGGVLLETRLTYKERNAAREQTESITYDRWTRAEERERRLNAPPKSDKTPLLDHRQEQAGAYHQFVLHGLSYGFTIRALARSRDDDDAPGKCVSEEDWKEMREFLCAAGILLGDPRNTKLDRKWSRERWDAERYTLPYPNRPAPKVSIFVHNTTPQHANNTATAAETA